jgi:hypothetical protein
MELSVFSMTGLCLNLFISSWLSLWAVEVNVNSATAVVPAHLVPTLETTVDRNEMRIGDVFHLTITVTHDPGIAVHSPDQNLELGQFQIKDILPRQTETLSDGKLQETITYELSTYFTGTFEIPAFDLNFETPEGQSGTISTTPIEINVVPLTPEESENLDIRDIKDPVLLEGESRLWMVITGIIVITLILIAGYFLWRYYKNRGKVVPVGPSLTPQEKALQELAHLRDTQEIYEQKQYKVFSTRVSEIIRIYIQERWLINAMDETTEEIIFNLKTTGLPEDIRTKFQEFFSSCDLIKFAKHEPVQEDMFDTIRQAEDIVYSTTPEPVQEETTDQPAASEELEPAGKEIH